MFWKLYENSRKQDMMELSQLLTAFLSYAAEQSGSSLDEAELRRALPQSAPWFLEQLCGQKENRKKLQQAVAELFQLPPARRQAIAQAAAHDMGFDRTTTPSRFFFSVPTLPAEEQLIVKEFFNYFYEVVFHRKDGPSINGHSCEATRDQFSSAYYQANGGLTHVCPICLHRKSNAIKENDLEHYFPKAVYPPLILHPSNLIFICRDCNETYKGVCDALQGGKKPLDRVFRPYRDTVKERAEVAFRREANTDWVKLLAADGSADEQERIENFDLQYKLEKRWSSDIAGIFEQIRTLCAGWGLPKEETRKKLREKCEDLQALSGFPDKFVESAYMKWLCETMFDAFYDNL